MKALLATLFLTFVAQADFADTFRPVRAGRIEGAIIPAKTLERWIEVLHRNRGPSFGIATMIGIEADAFWTPSEKDLEVVESRLRPALEKWLRDPLLVEPTAKDLPLRRKMLKTQIGEILGQYSKYRRQYLGLVIHGRRHIYLNSFPFERGSPYTKQFIRAADGGSQYWIVLYSLDDASFHTLAINGEA